MAYSLKTPGKRFRPFLVLTTAHMFDVPQTQALQVALAVEYVHCYSLIHDDLPAMDNAETRRGQPAVHVQFDEATALLAGNALSTEAFRILSHQSTHQNLPIRLQLVDEMATAIGGGGMMGGQMLDILGETQTYSLEAVEKMQDLKTGALIAFAARSGAILGEASPDKLAALNQYALALGLAFQVKDDLLDVESSQEILGKPTQNDSKKSTFVTLLGIEGAKEKAQNLAQTSLECLNAFGVEADLLRAAAHYVLERKF